MVLSVQGNEWAALERCIDVAGIRPSELVGAWNPAGPYIKMATLYSHSGHALKCENTEFGGIGSGACHKLLLSFRKLCVMKTALGWQGKLFKVSIRLV